MENIFMSKLTQTASQCELNVAMAVPVISKIVVRVRGLINTGRL